jgi:hypothetical protein
MDFRSFLTLSRTRIDWRGISGSSSCKNQAVNRTLRTRPAFKAASQFKFEQHHLHLRRWHARQPHQFIDGCKIGAEQFEYRASFAVASLGDEIELRCADGFDLTRWSSGAISSAISPASCTSVAPSRIKLVASARTRVER